jgi:hypothetical protein
LSSLEDTGTCNIQKTKENIPTDSDRNTIKEHHLNKATTNKRTKPWTTGSSTKTGSENV